MSGRKRKGKKPRQPGLTIRMKRGQFVPVVVRTKQGNITIRFGKDADGRNIIDAPRHCCDIILPERRPA